MEELLARMQGGFLYLENASLLGDQKLCLERQYDFNATRPHEVERRKSLMQEMFADLGEGCYIEPPLHANWGGAHTHLGSHVYANFNLTLVDDTDIFIGDNCMIGPNVTIATAGHPILPALREVGYQFNIPVHIGRNVWIGAGAVILPGVTIGDNSVIGAGAVVSKDIPANVIALGVPAKVVREIGDHDREYYYRDRRVDVDIPQA